MTDTGLRPRLVATFRALADPTRREILRLLGAADRAALDRAKLSSLINVVIGPDMYARLGRASRRVRADRWSATEGSWSHIAPVHQRPCAIRSCDGPQFATTGFGR